MTRRISVSVPDKTYDDFSRIAKEKAINRSKLVTKLLEEWMKEQEQKDELDGKQQHNSES